MYPQQNMMSPPPGVVGGQGQVQSPMQMPTPATMNAPGVMPGSMPPPPGVTGGMTAPTPMPPKASSMFADWGQDHEGEYVDLMPTDIGKMIFKVQQNPQAARGLMKALEQHEKGGNKSTGDFRKDAAFGVARLLSMLSQRS